MNYEFNDTEAEVMWVFGNKLAIAGIIMGVAAFIGLVTSTVILFFEGGEQNVVKLIQYLFFLIIAIIIYRPSDNFKIIAVSEGRDMDELKQGLKEFNLAFLLIAIMIIIMGMMQFLLILGKI